MFHYILVDCVPVVEPNILAWAKWMADNKDSCRIALTKIGAVKISTVFLGINHNPFGGKPELFETMIFGGIQDEYCARYYTLEDAMIGHERAVSLVKGENLADKE